MLFCSGVVGLVPCEGLRSDVGPWYSDWVAVFGSVSFSGISLYSGAPCSTMFAYVFPVWGTSFCLGLGGCFTLVAGFTRLGQFFWICPTVRHCRQVGGSRTMIAGPSGPQF